MSREQQHRERREISHQPASRPEKTKDYILFCKGKIGLCVFCEDASSSLKIGESHVCSTVLATQMCTLLYLPPFFLPLVLSSNDSKQKSVVDKDKIQKNKKS